MRRSRRVGRRTEIALMTRPQDVLGCANRLRRAVIGPLQREMVYVRLWPRPGFTRDRRKLTLAGRAIGPQVSFLAPPRTHTGGHYLPLATARFSAAGCDSGAGQEGACSCDPWVLVTSPLFAVACGALDRSTSLGVEQTIPKERSVASDRSGSLRWE
jgi:hypothetical protein